MVNIELKGGVVKEFDDGITAMEVAKSLGMGLYKAACVCRIDGEVKDLRTQINEDCKLEILTFDDDDGSARSDIPLRTSSLRLSSAFIPRRSSR